MLVVRMHTYNSYKFKNMSRTSLLVWVYMPKYLQLDCFFCGRTRIINLHTNQKGYDTFETTVGKLSARRIQIFPGYFCLGIILKVMLNNFQNNA